MCREDGSPSWGRKLNGCRDGVFHVVEKMGPLRGDGNLSYATLINLQFIVEKMGPLRGDGNTALLFIDFKIL